MLPLRAMAESPYRLLQRQAKAAGLPANRSAKELERMLAEAGRSGGSPAAATPKATSRTARTSGTNGSPSENTGATSTKTTTGLMAGEWRPDYPVRYAPLFPFIGDVLQVCIRSAHASNA